MQIYLLLLYMSLDLFASIDYFFSKIKCLSLFRFIFRLILVIYFFFNKRVFNIFNRALKVFKKNLKKKFSSNLKKNILKILVLIRLFYFILMRNISGLFPFVFGWRSHILIIFQFSLFFWILVKINLAEYKIFSYFSHFTPRRVPLILGVFLSKIELIRNIIRPLTLSLRLGIKITTGHILLALIRVIGSINLNLVIIVFLASYFFFELFVMFIQALVYRLLISQYFEG